MKASLTRIVLGALINVIVAVVLLRLLGFGFMVAAMLIWTVVWVGHWSDHADKSAGNISEDDAYTSFLYASVYGGLLTWIACLFVCFIPAAYTSQSKRTAVKAGWNILTIGVRWISSSTTKLLDIVLNYCLPNKSEDK